MMHWLRLQMNMEVHVFLCTCCKPSLPILSNINQTVNDIKTSTSERFDNLETKVTDLEQNMGKLITREEVDDMKNDLKEVSIRF